MPYYDTIDEDLARAKVILEEGRGEDVVVPNPLGAAVAFPTGGTIYGKDTYAAYKLLESFVTEIARLRWVVDAEEPVCRCGTVMVCPDVGCDLNKAKA